MTRPGEKKETEMFTTNDYEEAEQEAGRTGKLIWRHDNGTYAVAYPSEFGDGEDDDDGMEWTEVEKA